MKGPLAFSTSLAGHTKPQNALFMSKYKTNRPKNIDIQTEVCGKVGIGVEENRTKLEK